MLRRNANAASRFLLAHIKKVKISDTNQYHSSHYSTSSLHCAASDDNQNTPISIENAPSAAGDGIKYLNPPLKAHIFIDGTWLYYGLIKGRFNNDPMTRKLGPHWERRYRILYPEICNVIARDLKKQLERRNENTDRDVEIIRTNVFTSMKIDTLPQSSRYKMVSDFYESNFDVVNLVTEGPGEKCVDISLAVEMLALATVPDSYDIAVIITGDKDFIPALQKVRLKGRRTAIMSMKNSCNRELTRNDIFIKGKTHSHYSLVTTTVLLPYP